MEHNKKNKIEEPKIELYLHSINQEFPAGKDHYTFMKRHTEVLPNVSGELVSIEQVAKNVFGKLQNDWPAQWVENSWIRNWEKIGAGIENPFENPFERLLWREEKFGGIIFDPVEDRVYKVNETGLDLFKEIEKVSKTGDLKNFKTSKFATHEVESFISFLKGAGLWK